MSDDFYKKLIDALNDPDAERRREFIINQDIQREKHERKALDLDEKPLSFKEKILAPFHTKSAKMAIENWIEHNVPGIELEEDDMKLGRLQMKIVDPSHSWVYGIHRSFHAELEKDLISKIDRHFHKTIMSIYGECPENENDVLDAYRFACIVRLGEIWLINFDRQSISLKFMNTIDLMEKMKSESQLNNYLYIKFYNKFNVKDEDSLNLDLQKSLDIIHDYERLTVEDYLHIKIENTKNERDIEKWLKILQPKWL